MRGRKLTAFLLLALHGGGFLWADAMDGRWEGRITLDGNEIKLWLEVTNVKTKPQVKFDLLIAQRSAMIGVEDTAPRLEGETLHWTISAGSLGEFACEARRIDERSATAICKAADNEITMPLALLDGNHWVREDLETEFANPEQARFVEAVAQATRALAGKEFETFDTYFVANPKGALPDELFKRGLFIVMKFGRIEKVSFSAAEPPGAFVTIHFAEAQRDFYVHLDSAGKFIELTYVPLADPHFK